MHAVPRSPAVLVLLALAIGCTYDATEPLSDGPPAVAGRYVLERAEGQVAPALILSRADPRSGLPVHVFVTHDTVTIDSAGRYDQRALLFVTLGDQTVGTMRWADHGNVMLDGSALAFVSDYIEGVTFAGRLDGDAHLDITQDLTGEATATFVLARTP